MDPLIDVPPSPDSAPHSNYHSKGVPPEFVKFDRARDDRCCVYAIAMRHDTNYIYRSVEGKRISYAGFPRQTYIKIGVAENVNKRLGALQVAAPMELVVMDYEEFPTASLAYRVEKELHLQFRELRCRGEWFQFPRNRLDSLVVALRWHQLMNRKHVRVPLALFNKRLKDEAQMAVREAADLAEIKPPA